MANCFETGYVTLVEPVSNQKKKKKKKRQRTVTSVVAY
jgi:hypothetical protein